LDSGGERGGTLDQLGSAGICSGWGRDVTVTYGRGSCPAMAAPATRPLWSGPARGGGGVEALFYGPGILANRNRVLYGTDES